MGKFLSSGKALNKSLTVKPSSNIYGFVRYLFYFAIEPVNARIENFRSAAK